ncbi:MAG TPA: nucleotidyltransferase family protein [Bryobacteraceae bacterium]|nr:nucleotidyltransferase family protein [Bryobacteraceae bacterium]
MDGIRISDPNGGCQPTPLQELLLRAALMDGEAAFQAWLQWYGENGMERLDLGSFRLLPLLYWNLHRQAVQHPMMGILKGIHRRAWVENRLLSRRLAPALETIHGAGIPTLLLKGASLGRLHYADVGLRPMNDLDVLVPEDRTMETIRLLEEHGWQQVTTGNFRMRKSDLSFRHSLGFVNAEGLEIDLHWHALYLVCFRDADRAFWRDSVPMEFEGIPTRTLCPTDQLIHACAHGLMWSEIPPVRWVADAVAVMRSSAIDWQRLTSLTDQMRLILPVREGLRYLADSLDIGVPAAAWDGLADRKISRSEILDYQRLQNPLELQSPVDTFRAVYGRYRRNAGARFPLARLGEFVRFMQFHWQVENTWQVWPAALRWASLRLRRMA